MGIFPESETKHWKKIWIYTFLVIFKRRSIQNLNTNWNNCWQHDLIKLKKLQCQHIGHLPLFSFIFPFCVSEQSVTVLGSDNVKFELNIETLNPGSNFCSKSRKSVMFARPAAGILHLKEFYFSHVSA